GFAPLAAAHPLVARIHRAHSGLRVPRSLAVYESALPVVLEQKVTGLEARRTWRALLGRYGEPAPGPTPPGSPPLRVPPGPETMAELPYTQMHPLGVERRRAETLRAVAAAADRLERATALPSMAEAHAVLRSVAGVGAWTAAEVAIVALGDADAVSVGDYHLPNQVCFALAGERTGTDERMLELLAPFAPHRGRVIRLIGRAAARPERRGPRLTPMDNRRR
nr:DNA-3-methyladenine glycosylase 2 family protein [Acidimicrobiia bacterium]